MKVPKMSASSGSSAKPRLWILIILGLTTTWFMETLAMVEVSLTHTNVLVPNDQKFIFLDKLRIRKVNKTHVLKGEFTTHVELDDSIDVLCLSYKKAGNDYKLLPYKVGPTPFCKFIQSEKMIYPELKALTDFPDVDTCPWPAGTYNINGYEPDISKIPPVADSGDYMVQCQVEKNGELMNGMKIYGSVLNMAYGK